MAGVPGSAVGGAGTTGGTGVPPAGAFTYSFARRAASRLVGTVRPRGRLRSRAAVSIAVPIRHISLRRSRPPWWSGSWRWPRVRLPSTRSTRRATSTIFCSRWSRAYWSTSGRFSRAREADGFVRSLSPTGAACQLWSRFVWRSPEASPFGTRMTARARGSCSVNSCRLTFASGRKYGKTRNALNATSALGRRRTRSRTTSEAASHCSAATMTVGSVDPRWKRKPSPTAW